jgi:hypothetical protein
MYVPGSRGRPHSPDLRPLSVRGLDDDMPYLLVLVCLFLLGLAAVVLVDVLCGLRQLLWPARRWADMCGASCAVGRVRADGCRRELGAGELVLMVESDLPPARAPHLVLMVVPAG